MDFGQIPVSMILIETRMQSNDTSFISKVLASNGFQRDWSFVSWKDINQLWVNKDKSEKWLVDIFENSNRKLRRHARTGYGKKAFVEMGQHVLAAGRAGIGRDSRWRNSGH